MPPLVWTCNPASAIPDFESRHKNVDAGALFAWAQYTVESLHYLDDIDRAFDSSHAATGGHNPDLVDVAHARWATSTCITALDLCAAGLGRCFCGHTGPREFDLGWFDPKRNAASRGALPLLALQWVDNIRGDPDYEQIMKARHSLVHSRVTRHLTLAIGGPPVRVKLNVEGMQVPVRDLIELARDVATKHVSAFFDLLPKV